TWRGVDTASVLASNVSAFTNQQSGTNTLHTTSSVTTTEDDAMLINSYLFVFDSPGVITGPDGMSLGASVSSLRVYTEEIETAGATGSRAATTSGGCASTRIMFALRRA